MTSLRRVWLTVGVIGAAVAVQAALLAHMALGPGAAYPEAKKSFGQIPTNLVLEKGLGQVTWNFHSLADEKELRKSMPFVPIDMVFRGGRCNELNLDVELYLVHTDDGSDRKHHPEICLRDVQQIPEEPRGRAEIKLDNDPSRVVQRFAFRASPTRLTTVYYWHYTFLPVPQPGQTWLQTLHQTVGHSPPSVTVQVTTAVPADRWPVIEQSLIAPLDRRLRAEYLPANVRMGHDRLPIGLVEKAP